MAHQFTFGTGNIYIIPVSGTSNITPIAVAAIQNVSVDFDGDSKSLYGQSQFPLDTARGKVKITGKFELGQINSNLWNTVFFGSSTSLGTSQITAALSEGPASPSANIITAANGSTFIQDLGVYSVAGVQWQLITTGTPSTGQYKVSNAGVYTFATADASVQFYINYEYTKTASGQMLTVNNQLMGAVPVFELDLYNNTKSKSQLLKLFACTSSKFQFPLKQDDYGLQSFDFMAQDNGNGQILTWSTTEG